MIPIQYALRRRMMSKKPAPQWTLTIQNVISNASVSINGENLTAGSYVVDDGTIASFVAGLGATIANKIVLDGVTVASSIQGDVVTYDLEIHANYIATSTTSAINTMWEITTQ